MSTKHPVTPPPELVVRLWREASEGRIYADEAPIGEIFNHGVYLAYQAGADMELEACCEWLDARDIGSQSVAPCLLRAVRRPQPPITRREAISALDDIDCLFDLPLGHYNTLFRALETLPND